MEVGSSLTVGLRISFRFDSILIMLSAVNISSIALLLTPCFLCQIIFTRALARNVSAGVGRGGHLRLSRSELDELLELGVHWAVEHGYGDRGILSILRIMGGCLLLMLLR